MADEWDFPNPFLRRTFVGAEDVDELKHTDNTERSAKLEGAVEGEERDRLWDELKSFIVVEGKEPGDDDEVDNGHITH